MICSFDRGRSYNLTRGAQRRELAHRRRQLIDDMRRLQEELKRDMAHLPGHSVRLYQMMALEELERAIRENRSGCATLGVSWFNLISSRTIRSEDDEIAEDEAGSIWKRFVSG